MRLYYFEVGWGRRAPPGTAGHRYLQATAKLYSDGTPLTQQDRVHFLFLVAQGGNRRTKCEAGSVHVLSTKKATTIGEILGIYQT